MNHKQWDAFFHLIVEITSSDELKERAKEIDIMDLPPAIKTIHLMTEYLLRCGPLRCVELNGAMFGPFASVHEARRWIQESATKGMKTDIKPLYSGR